MINLKRGHEKHGSAEYQSLITLVQQEAVEKLDDSTRRYAEHLLCYNEGTICELSSYSCMIDTPSILMF